MNQELQTKKLLGTPFGVLPSLLYKKKRITNKLVRPFSEEEVQMTIKGLNIEEPLV